VYRTTPRSLTCRTFGIGVVLSSLSVLVSAPAAHGQTGLPPELKLVSESGYGFATIRVAQVLGDGPLAQLPIQEERDRMLAPLTKAGLKIDQIDRVTALLPSENNPIVLVSTTVPYDRAALRRELLPDGKAWPSAPKGTLEVLADPRTTTALVFIDPKTFLLGPEKEVKALYDHLQQGGVKSPFASAVELATQHQVVLSVSPEMVVMLLMPRQQRAVPDDGPPPAANPVKRPEPGEKPRTPPPPPPPPPEEIAFRPLLDEPGKVSLLAAMLADLPPEALPYKPLFLAKTITLTLDLGKDTRMTVRLDYANEADARDGEIALQTALYVAREGVATALGGRRGQLSAGFQPFVTSVKTALREAQVKRVDKVVATSIILKMDGEALKALAVEVHNKAAQTQDANNLKQLGLALHLYHDSYGVFPRNISKDGKPLLSWRVAILPYIEQNDLYMQFKLDEPWDSEHNKKLLAKMPKLFAPVVGKAPIEGGTYYQGLAGPGAIFDPMFIKGPGLRMVQIADGTSNTIMLVEASKAVPWTAPEDVPFDPKQLPRLGGQFPQGFHAATADGAVHFLRRDMPADVLRALITINGGEIVDWDKAEVPGPGRR
jgi:hypothetical protein